MFDTSELKTTDGAEISILNTGTQNTHAGPDFLDARVKSGDKIWAGSIEIHLRASDWNKHNHSQDAAYNNVILHVVLDNDLPGSTKTFPVLELKERIHHPAIQRYIQMMKNTGWVPCEKVIGNVQSLNVIGTQDRMMAERLQVKTQRISELLNQSQNDWEQVAFILISRYFGAAVNTSPFEQVAQKLPVKVWSKYRDEQWRLEALLMGTAGFLETNFEDNYPRQLKTEFNYLRRLHSIEVMEASQFKFLRMRPASFPTIRLAQLASFMTKGSGIFSCILDASSITELKNQLKCKPTDYWLTHYRPDHASKKTQAQLGKHTIDTLIINAIVPLLYAYGSLRNEDEYIKRAQKFLEDTPSEKNSITDKWTQLGIKCSNAYESQSMIHLKNEYCSLQKCLHCNIGADILRS